MADGYTQRYSLKNRNQSFFPLVREGLCFFPLPTVQHVTLFLLCSPLPGHLFFTGYGHPPLFLEVKDGSLFPPSSVVDISFYFRFCVRNIRVRVRRDNFFLRFADYDIRFLRSLAIVHLFFSFEDTRVIRLPVSVVAPFPPTGIGNRIPPTFRTCDIV